MLALVRLTRASKPAARKCSPEGGEGGGEEEKAGDIVRRKTFPPTNDDTPLSPDMD